MKPLTITCCFALLLVIAACNDTATESAEAPKTDSPKVASATTEPAALPQLDSATRAKNWQDYMTPGAIHKMMAAWDGTWTADITMYMPGAPPQKMTGQTVNKTIMNGLYQTSMHTGNMMGMPFEGRGTMGYDKHKKVFEATWIDNMGSGIMKSEGPWDEASKTITLTGKMMDAEYAVERDFKQVMKLIDDNTHQMEMYGTGSDGKEAKFMEIKYTRKK